MTFKKDTAYVFASTNKFNSEELFSFKIGDGATLCGAGDFDGNGYNDILLEKNGETVIYYGNEAGFTLSSFILKGLDGELLLAEAPELGGDAALAQPLVDLVGLLPDQSRLSGVGGDDSQGHLVRFGCLLYLPSAAVRGAAVLQEVHHAGDHVCFELVLE